MTVTEWEWECTDTDTDTDRLRGKLGRFLQHAFELRDSEARGPSGGGRLATCISVTWSASFFLQILVFGQWTMDKLCATFLRF